ncbi:MAG: hypothetical protein C0506_09325 [Anaerolinea sp.]|nr:hypothetical protein [Anaerolinea sp.]
MTVRVDVDRLPAEVVDALNRGDIVEFERDGELVASVRAEPKRISWREYWELRRNAPPLDDDFLNDVEEVRRMLNAPMTDPWES